MAAVAAHSDCSNVKDWNFFHSSVTANNLGGVGPNKSDKQEIRYADVADGIDLVLTVNSAKQARKYEVNPKWFGNGINGKFGVVNIKGGTSVALKFTLVEAGTENPVSIAPDQKVFFSVFDLDNSDKSGKRHEYLEFTTPVDSYSVASGTTVKMSGNKDRLKAVSSRLGTASDNPSDPLSMTQVQKDNAVWLTYKGRNTWGMKFGESGNAKHKGGRNLLFAGRAEGDCPPGPVPPATGACTSGIEGIVQGGGRVCCPDACGNSEGSYAKWASTPNKCGGPKCDKVLDGERSLDRYNICCVGKPITGGTEQATISASYGIVSQRRFCAGSGMGSDSAPCINKLPRISTIN
jgi:hypothetical protein